MPVEDQRVIMDIEAKTPRNGGLPVFDATIHELFDAPAVDADDMIMMRALIQLENSHAVFEMMTGNEAGGLELREHAINGGQANVFVSAQELPVDVLGGQVARGAALQNLQNFEARQRDLQAGFAQVLTFHSMFSGDHASARGAMRYHLRPLSSIPVISRHT
jgi:hypothetical protein